MTKKKATGAYTVIGEWSNYGEGDRPWILAIIPGVHRVTVGRDDYWVMTVNATDPQAAGDAAQEKMLAAIQPRLDAGEVFIEEFHDLVRGKMGTGYGMHGIRTVAEAIDERYKLTDRHMHPAAPFVVRTELRWWVIEKIVNYCGGDVEHFRDLFAAAGGKIEEDPWL